MIRTATLNRFGLVGASAGLLLACEPTSSFSGGSVEGSGTSGNFVDIDGLSVNAECRPLCQSALSDDDGDGWGWENQQSCLVEGSRSAVGEPCSVRVPVSMLMAAEAPSSNNFDLSSIQPPAQAPPEFELGRTAERPVGNESTGFFVSDGRLFDARGNEFVMRGVNNPLVWFQGGQGGSAMAWLSDIANTGANAVRLVWQRRLDSGGAPPLPLLRDAIARTIALGMIPMVELHDATGDRTNEAMWALARYYASPEVSAILEEFEEHVLINIANEWSGADFGNAYREAIDIIRAAGLKHTIVIDSNGWGQNMPTLLDEATGLLNYDPQGNLLFSVHMYERFSDPAGQPRGERVRVSLQRAVSDGIPLIVGEFGFQHGDDGSGSPVPVPFDVMMEQANRYGIGYLAWSWTGNGGGVEYLDLVERSSGALSQWGTDLVEGPSIDIGGIRETSVPASVFLP